MDFFNGDQRAREAELEPQPEGEHFLQETERFDNPLKNRTSPEAKLTRTGLTKEENEKCVKVRDKLRDVASGLTDFIRWHRQHELPQLPSYSHEPDYIASELNGQPFADKDLSELNAMVDNVKKFEADVKSAISEGLSGIPFEREDKFKELAKEHTDVRYVTHYIETIMPKLLEAQLRKTMSQ